MRGGDHDGALVAKPSQAAHQRMPRRVVEAGERLVEQQQPRAVQQGAFERQALTHPSREPGDRVVGAIGQAGMGKRADHSLARVVEAVQPREELEVLARGQLRIEIQVVAEQAEAGPEPRARRAGVERAVVHLPRRRREQRRQNRQQRRLPCPVRPEQAEDRAGAAGETHAGQRAPPAEVPRDVVDHEAIEVTLHSR